MAGTLSILLNAVLSITDTSVTPNPTIVTRNLNNPTLPSAVVFAYDTQFQVGTSATTFNLPATTVWIVYVKNLSASSNITVTFTPTGGSSETLVLVPGGVFLYFQPAESAGGITALSLTSSSGTVGAEVLVAN